MLISASSSFIMHHERRAGKIPVSA